MVCMKRTNIHLAPDQIDRLKKLAGRKGITVAELIRRAIESYLERHDKREQKHDGKTDQSDG